MPGMFNGKVTEYTEYIFKMEAYLSTLDPGGKGGEILRAAATEAKDMDDEEVTNLAAICWNVSALNSALASCSDHHDHRRSWHACSSSGASIPIWPQSVAGAEQWCRPKSGVEGAASMAGIIAPSRAKSIGELQRFVMDWELRVAEHEARQNEHVQDSVKVAALKRMIISRDGRTSHRRPQHVP